jgi:hypothetical protein
MTGAQVSASRFMATIAPCAHWWSLYGCAVLGVGQLRLASENVAIQTLEWPPYVATGGRLGVEVPFAPRLGFRGFGEVVGTLTSAAVLIDKRPGWTTPRTSGGIGAGLYLFFN